jgi:DNA-directed RNA polymerase specialized sigma24 family protein
MSPTAAQPLRVAGGTDLDFASYVAARRPALLGWWALVLTLPAVQRATVVLRYYEQLSVAETAAVLGCATGTVKSNTSRGLAALRRRRAGTALAG